MSEISQELLSFASEDPYIARNLSEFGYFSVGGTTMVRPTKKRNLAVGDEGDLRSQKVSSVKGLIGKREIQNDPNSLGREDRIFNLDTIPYRIYRKMERDPQFFLATQLMIGVISSLKYTISVKNRPDIEAVLNHIYEPHHAHVVSNIISTSFPYGFAFAEKVMMKEQLTLDWVVDGEEQEVFSGLVASFKKVKFINPEANISFYKKVNTDEISRIVQRQLGRRVNVKRKRLLWFALDKKFSNVFGNSRYKAGYSSWYYDTENYQLSLMHTERNGSPHIEARYPEGPVHDPKTGEERFADDIMAEALDGLVSNGVILLPSTRDEKTGNYLWQINYVEPKNTDLTTYNAFAKINERKKYQSIGIPDAILAPDSNFSQIDALLNTMMIIAEPLIDQIEEAVETDLIKYGAAINFGTEAATITRFTLDRAGLKRSDMLKELLKEQMRLLNSMPNHVPKYSIDIEATANEIGVKMVPTGDVVKEKENQDDGGGMTPQEQQQRTEDSNDRDRKTPDNRKRERPTKSDVK